MIDFEALLGALNREGLEFIVVDGAAATAHGAARLTQDLDVVYARSDENMERSGLSQRIIRIFAARPRGFRSFGHGDDSLRSQFHAHD